MKTINSSKFRILFSLFLALSIIGVQDANAQFWKKKKKEVKKTATKKTPPKKKGKSIKSLTKSSKKIEGLFTIYQDTVSGSIKLLVKKEQLNKDFIYFSQIANGVVDAGQFRGAYQGSTVFHVKKYYNKIEFVAPNTSFYFDKNSALSKSSKANISDAVVASGKLLASDDKKGEYLIDANSLFLSETFTRVKRPRFPGQSPFSFSLGRLDKNKSKINEIKNYPENTNVKTEYVYSNPSVLNGGSAAVTDGRNVSIKVFHTFMNMPEEDYKPRMDDARVGYFLTETNDMTTTKTINYRDMIHRWKLVKKNPNAALSEPVTPITWWIENSTPLKWRETIKEGVLAWNVAFEKAGFKNAMVVKVQPDDATWDAGDVRYNVLRWTSSPNPPFGGYGPSFVNPRTGEILGADIMLEFVHFTNRVFADKLYNDATANMYVETTDELEAKTVVTKVNGAWSTLTTIYFKGDTTKSLFKGLHFKSGQAYQKKCGGFSLNSKNKKRLQKLSSIPFTLCDLVTKELVTKGYTSKPSWNDRVDQYGKPLKEHHNTKVERFSGYSDAIMTLKGKKFYLELKYSDSGRMFYKFQLEGLRPQGKLWETLLIDSAEAYYLDEEQQNALIHHIYCDIKGVRVTPAEAVMDWDEDMLDTALSTDYMAASNDEEFGERLRLYKAGKSLSYAREGLPTKYLFGWDFTTSGLIVAGTSFHSPEMMKSGNIHTGDTVYDAHEEFNNLLDLGVTRKEAKAVHQPLLHGGTWKGLLDVVHEITNSDSLSLEELQEKLVGVYGNCVHNIVDIATWGTHAVSNTQTNLVFTLPDGFKATHKAYFVSVHNKITVVSCNPKHKSGTTTHTVIKDMP